MPCVATPPPQIVATITVGPAPNYALVFTPNTASAPYVSPNGDLDLSCVKAAVKVKLTLATPGVVFYQGYGRDSLSFVDDATSGGAKQPLPASHHQFPGGLHHVGTQTIWFTYHNDWDCGAGDGKPRCAKSAYGVYLGNEGGFLRHADPIINNGGNQF